MKTLQITFLLVLFATLANATILTVSNNINSPGQYTTLQAAIDAATAGDTIYVSGSPYSYGDVSVTKQLTFVGAGYNPNNQFFYSTSVNTFNLHADGITIIGFQIGLINGYPPINYITLKRNNIGIIQFRDGNSLSINWVIYKNIINSIYSRNQWPSTVPTENFSITNNIITGIFESFEYNTILISNNIFLNYTGSVFSGMTNTIVTNNIFYGTSTLGCNYCTFNNNISVGNDHPNFIYDSNTGGGNLENAALQFESVADTAFDYAYDYHLATGSPGIGAGTDASDIGIYGGGYPFPSGGDVPWQTSAMPAIPQIMKMDIQNATLPVDGTLQVKIKARKQD